ncbi:MAG: CHAT domain-containing protein [Leptospiraceae bacterium]|nr:CHAT domain-containing protein [Leptospiraceae bacterium]MCP5497244.1 CHAT domain-containing protein [Leptospiraceae bacterium]
MIDLLIDRVGNVNVFNVFHSGRSDSGSHLQSVMDEDLILEYIKEAENISRVSNTFHANHGLKLQVEPDVLRDLKVLGETFYDQFFPKEISEKLRQTSEKYLHFNIDQGLSDIPWELLHDGSCFLSDKFYIGKTVKGSGTPKDNSDHEKLKMLIVVDPTEDLEWAQREGEELFKSLKQQVSPSRLEIQFISGKQITKLKLLSMIRGKHIIHYSGHLYFSNDSMENGWLLYNNKVLKAREIKSSGFSTNLVFSNSCQSVKNPNVNLSPGIMNYFAGSFLMAGIKCFIGTNWEVVDNEKTLDFTIRFYLSLFNEGTVGESLFIAKEYARRNYEPWDLTWANYSLHGPPNYIIVSEPVEENKRKIINPTIVFNHYPTNIARTYMEYLRKEEEHDDMQTLKYSIITNMEEFSKLIGMIVFSDHYYRSLGKNSNNLYSVNTLLEWWNQIYNCIWNFKQLKISMVMDSLLEVLSTNKEVIYKIIDWVKKLETKQLEEDALQGYLITMQYYYENLLMEMSEFESCNIVYISQSSNSHCYFTGTKPTYNLIPSSEGYIHEQLERYRDRLILIHKGKKMLLPLYGIKVDNINTEDIEFEIPGPGRKILTPPDSNESVPTTK